MGLILLQWHLGRGVGFNNTTGFDGAPLTTVDVVNKILCGGMLFRQGMRGNPVRYLDCSAIGT